MDIRNPRRILLLAPPETLLTPIFEVLTPTSDRNPPTIVSPAPPDNHQIITPYYTALIPIWRDSISSSQAWKSEWLSTPSAASVIDAVGAWIFAFPKPVSKESLNAVTETLKTISDVIKHHNGHGAGGNGDADNYEHSYGGNDDALKLAITLPSQTVPCLIFEDAEWEDLCRENGAWEYIDGTISPATAGKRNEFGETTGLPRLLEALAANQWDNDDADLSLADIDLEDLEDTTQDDDEDTLAKVIDADSIDEQELYRPIFAQKEPGGKDGGEEPESDEEELAGEDAQVEALQRMMLKMQAVRDMGANMPEQERRKFAAQSVRKLMKEL